MTVKIKEAETPKEDQPKGLKSKVDEMYGLMQKMQAIPEKKKLKMVNFKFPFGFAGKMRKLWKKNKIAVVYLKNDNVALPTVGEIKEGNVIVGDTQHDGSKEFVWLWRGKTPIMFVPQWDTLPIGTKAYHDAVEDGRTTNHQAITIRAIKMAQQETEKKKMKMGSVVWIIIAAVIVGYLLFSNVGGG